MKFLDGFVLFLRKVFPSTFTIAILLTAITFILALVLTEPAPTASWPANSLESSHYHWLQIAGFWYRGLWNTDMLAFAVQMMLILVLGYVLASTAFFNKIISYFLQFCTNTSRTSYLISIFTILFSFLNWGLGLIFGAVFARKAGEKFSQQNKALNYALVAASGYTGLMVWHGGISGSAPLKVAEAGHFLALTGQDLKAIPFSETVFSPMNLLVSLVLIISIPALLALLGKKSGEQIPEVATTTSPNSETASPKGIEKLDHTNYFGTGLGLLFILLGIVMAIFVKSSAVITPNYINFLLLGCALLLHKNINSFLHSVRQAMTAAGGILIQFPLYFGIMGMMKYSGLVEHFSSFLLHVSNENSFPIYTFLSAGLVNLFVPSGGGQWAVQGPVIVEAARTMHLSLAKAVMALAYGDQLTNMLQPFWALPLLGITGLKARDIIPYTLIIMVAGLIIYASALMIF